MASRCPACMRPEETCYCRYIEPVSTEIMFVFLMHPKEAKKQRTGTGRLASLSLPGSKIIIDIDFSNNNELNEILKDPHNIPLILYPSPAALYADGSENFYNEKISGLPEGKKIVLILIDATWFFAKKILRLSRNLEPIQKLSFKGTYKSEYTFKKQPEEFCLSTIETCYYVIKEFQTAGLVGNDCNPEPLMLVFRKMIEVQLQSEKEREAKGLPSRYAAGKAEADSAL